MSDDKKQQVDSYSNGEREVAHQSIEEMFSNELLQAVLTIVQDGICLLSADLDVLYANYAMREWFNSGNSFLGEKCYSVFHDRKAPCIGCPVLRSMLTKKMETDERRYEKQKKKTGWHRIFSAPILDSENTIIMYIEYVREITEEKKSGLSVELMQEQIQSLRSVIEQKDEEQKQKEQVILGNVKHSFDIVLKYLNSVLDEDSLIGVRQQFELTLHGVGGDSGLAVQLSGQELLIARYIANGYLSKEIADELSVSKKTVDYHRTNLRKKLKLESGDNLKTAIEKFFKENGLS